MKRQTKYRSACSGDEKKTSGGQSITLFSVNRNCSFCWQQTSKWRFSQPSGGKSFSLLPLAPPTHSLIPSQITETFRVTLLFLCLCNVIIIFNFHSIFKELKPTPLSLNSFFFLCNKNYIFFLFNQTISWVMIQASATPRLPSSINHACCHGNSPKREPQ